MHTLESGLTTVIDELHGAPVVAFQVWVRTGCYDELDDERGLAHLHEHMLFKGTPSRGVGEVAASIEACGGQINAWTSHDHTCYHVVLPAHEWRQGLEVLADAVCHSLFDPEELTREIEVVAEEIKRASDSPGQVGYRRLFELAFAGHPYALPVLGTLESVRSMTQERMLAFYHKHYVSGNTTVIATGDFDAKEVALAIEHAFADLPRAQPPIGPAPQPEPVQPRADVVAATFSESRVIYAWPIPALEHPDVPALDVLAILLGQGDSSRLVRKVQREQHYVNDIGTSTWTPARAGLFSLTLLTSSDRLEIGRRSALQTLAELRNHGVTQAEVDKARNNILSDATYKLETVQGQAHAIGYFTASTGDPRWDRVYNRAVASITPGEVMRVARRYLVPETVQIVAMPGTDGTEAPVVVTPEQLLSEVVELLAIEPNAALAVRTPDVIDGIERIDLPSGDVLLVQPDRGVPMFGLRVAAMGGLRGETPAVSGRSHLLAQMLTRGTSRRSSHEIAHEIETLAAGLGGFTGRNSIGMSAVALTHAKDAMLDLLFDTLFESAMPAPELEHERAVQLEDLRHQADAPARVALRTMATALYGDHPYGLDILGTPESIAALSRDELLAWSRQQLAPGRLVYSAVGDLDAEELAAAITARTPTDRTPLEQLHPQPVSELAGVLQLRPHAEKQQAHIVLGFRGTTLFRQDRFALDVLSTILSGQSGRLFLELRDKQSLAYTVSSMHVDGLDEGYFALYIGTSPDKAEQALAGLRTELDKVLQGPVLPEELDRARRFLAGGHAIGLQRRSSRASTLCLNELYGLGRHAYRGQLANLLAVTADDILQAARKYLTLDRHVEVVLAPQPA